MIPGEYRVAKGHIVCNQNRKTIVLRVSHTGDRPVQVGSHYHFAETNRFLSFDRRTAIGMRLNIAAGTAVRFEPGEEKEVELVELAGDKKVFGINNLTDGSISDVDNIATVISSKGFKGRSGQ